MNAQTSLEKLNEAKPDAFPTRIPQPTLFANKKVYIHSHIWPPLVAIFLALRVWEAFGATVRPRDTRPRAARTSQVHVFELGPKKFEMNEFMK